ncbi:response regulator [Breoghania sp. L-A4]|uniref:response regulator n=1 Tax=Breoghania sp. L-A4 TaxID=2304600 RepID=UPI000E35CC89|nr:response regulator [Breoghania sp. L-A4]AXS39681.1 hybrid sensor histidine kinase/response regulator [Breoghania sp. L-A4]
MMQVRNAFDARDRERTVRDAANGALAHESEHRLDRDGTVSAKLADMRKLSVLLVDDDEVDAKYICWVLGCISRYKFDIVHVTSSEEAIAADSGRRFDLYLVDFWLMHETAIPLIGELGEMHSRAPIVVLTNLNNGEIEDLGIRAGALGFLCKGDLSEKALELVISSALFTRQVELDLKQRISDLEAQRDHALAGGSAVWLQALSNLNAVSRTFDAALSSGADARKDEGAENRHDAFGTVAGGLVSARRELLDTLSGVGSPEAIARPSQPVDVGSAIVRAIEAYRDEARLNGVDLAFEAPREPVLLVRHPAVLQAFIIMMIDCVARGNPSAITISVRIVDDAIPACAGSLHIAVTPEGGSAARPSCMHMDTLRRVAASIGARIAGPGEDAGPLGEPCCDAPDSPGASPVLVPADAGRIGGGAIVAVVSGMS